MDPVSLFWILMIFFPPPGLWEAFGIIGILAMVAMALVWLAYSLVATCYGVIGLARRLIQGDRLVIACALSVAICVVPWLGVVIVKALS